MKNVLATVAGIVVRIVVVMSIDMISGSLYLEFVQHRAEATEQVSLHSTVPTGPYVLMLFAWIIGTVASAFVSTLISRQPKTEAVLMGFCGIVAVITDTYVYNHPIWLPVIGVIVTVVAAWLGARLGMSVGGSVGESVGGSVGESVGERVE